MNILYLIPYYYPAIEYGGPVTVTWDLAKEISKNNSITVLTTDAKNARERINISYRKYNKNLKIIYLKNINNKLAWNMRIFLPLGIITNLIKIVPHTDIIHIHDYFTVFTVLGCLFGKLYKKPVVISSHGSISLKKERGKLLFKKIFNLLFFKFINYCTSYFVCISEDEKEDYTRYILKSNTTKLKRIYNPVKLEKLKKYRKKVAFDYIVYVGRIYFTKNVALLLRAFLELKKRNKISDKIKLLIVGPDAGGKKELDEILLALNADDSVVFTGGVSRDVALGLIKNSMFLVQPSLSDPFSMTIAESMMLKRNVLASSNVGIRNFLTYNQVFTDEQDFYEKFEKMIKYTENGLNRDNLDNYNIAKKEFGIKNITSQYMQLYSKLI